MNNPSSFSSISFEAESAIKFKKLAKEQSKTHTELLNELMTHWAVLSVDEVEGEQEALEILQNEDRIKWASEALARDSKNELME